MITRETLQEHLACGMSVSDIAHKYDKCAETIYRMLRIYELSAQNHRWTKTDDQYLRFHAYHKSQAAMAKHLGVSIYALRNRLYKLELTPQRCIGYTLQDLARDTATDVRIVSAWHRKYGMPAKKLATRMHIDISQLSDWLASGHALRIHPSSIRHAAEWIREIYDECKARYITSAELHTLCAVATYCITHRPASLMQVDDGYVYDRDTMAHYLAVNRYLLYAGARGPYIERIRMLAREYVHGTDIAAYSTSVYRSLHHAYVHNGLPRPLRTRPNVWQREPFMQWLQVHADNSKWLRLMRYLDGIHQARETR